MNDSDVRTTTKRELVSRIADATGQTKVVVRDILQRFLNEVIEELASGNRLEFREFGVFEVRERAARTAQNPRTLEKVMVPAKKVVKFKVGRVMRQRVCEELSAAEVDGSVGRKGAAPKGAAAGGSAARGTTPGGTVNGGTPGIDPSQESSNGSDGGDPGSSGTQKPTPPTPPPTRPGSPF